MGCWGECGVLFWYVQVYCRGRMGEIGIWRESSLGLLDREPEQAPPLPDFVLEPVYPEFMPSKDEVFLGEEQPLPVVVSPTTDSPGYIADSDPEEDPTGYPTDGGDHEDDDGLLAILSPPPSPTPSPLSPWSSPLPQIPLPPLPSYYDPAESRDTIYFLYTSYLLPSSTPPSRTLPLILIPLPTSSPPLLLPSKSHTLDVTEVTLPPRKRLCIALGLRYEVGESSFALTARPTRGFRADYDFVATLDDKIRRDPERDDDRVLMSRQLNMLCRDRRAYAQTARLMESEARLSREAWVQSMDVSDTARAEVMSLRTIVLAQHAEIAGLQAVDHIRQTQLAKALTLLKIMQTQMAALQRRRGLARGPTQPEIPKEAGSSS
uniref:Uncharacterized protein n=1 Tax=Tanacetum cinerariifolium TaxID=118510 RepID=A0A699J297_TANCI|nr:hypothetical protein [Tanacetum cinerariifolium]